MKYPVITALTACLVFLSYAPVISSQPQETEDKSTEEEEDYAPQSPRASLKARRKYQSPSNRPPHDANLDTSTVHIQGLGGASNSPIGLPDGHCLHTSRFILFNMWASFFPSLWKS
ncbi:hypothetical protein BYT27DRAFT_7340001 [Phlegmacium glaucopus]|nr:hypothetical protein BYT27DRAFT_7340001 [Phlegmacium glaucopus]